MKKGKGKAYGEIKTKSHYKNVQLVTIMYCILGNDGMCLKMARLWSGRHAQYQCTIELKLVSHNILATIYFSYQKFGQFAVFSSQIYILNDNQLYLYNV